MAEICEALLEQADPGEVLGSTRIVLGPVHRVFGGDLETMHSQHLTCVTQRSQALYVTTRGIDAHDQQLPKTR